MLAWPLAVRASMLRILVLLSLMTRGDLLQHAETVVAKHRQLDRIRCRRRLSFARPLDVDPALGFIHQVHDVGTVHARDGDALCRG